MWIYIGSLIISLEILFPSLQIFMCFSLRKNNIPSVFMRRQESCSSPGWFIRLYPMSNFKTYFFKDGFFYSFMFVKDIKPIWATILKPLPTLIGLSDSRGLPLEQFIFFSCWFSLVGNYSICPLLLIWKMYIHS